MTQSSLSAVGFRRLPHVLFVVFAFAVVFSVQYPLPGVGSQYASINLSDVVVLALFGTFVVEQARTGRWSLSLSLPVQTGWFVLVGAWSVLSVVVALLRSPYSVLPNVLWTMKFFEIVAVFVLAQAFADRVDWRRVLAIIVAGGAILSVGALARSLTGSTFAQPTLFWRNPSTFAVFLALPALLALTYAVVTIGDRPHRGLAGLGVALVVFAALASVGSRAGLLAAVVGAITAGFLARDRLPTTLLAAPAIGGLVLGFGAIWVVGRQWIVSRFLPVTLSDGTVVINPTAMGGLVSRYNLAHDGIHLWASQPLFGYGWFASPENPAVGFLDFFYVQVLVDVGIVGFFLILFMYLVLLRTLLSARHQHSFVVAAAGSGWLLGVLVAGIGGAHPRVPRILFLLLIVVVAAGEIRPQY